MKIIIDCNRVIASLIKESTTREILFDKTFEFYAPEFIKTELEEHKDEIIQIADISKEEFEILSSLIFEHITIIPKEEYQTFIDKLKTEIKDPDDIPYLALCLSIKEDGIWTHDPHFQEQKKCKVYTNIDMLKLSLKSTFD